MTNWIQGMNPILMVDPILEVDPILGMGCFRRGDPR